MRNINLKLVSRVLICISIISIIIMILWIVIESRFTRDSICGRRLQDWLFTVPFYIFLLSATGWIILKPFGKIKNKAVRAILTVISCSFFIVIAFYGYIIKYLEFGDKVYANRHVYLKYYFNLFEQDSCYLYKTDGILFIKEGEVPEFIEFYLYDDDIDGYVDSLKRKYE